MTLPQPSFYGPVFAAPRADRRRRNVPVSVERRIAPRRRDDRLEKAEG